MMGTSGIVGPCILQAAGAGYSFQLRQTDQVGVAFFGDGAVGNGAFHEGLNLATIWDLPVLFFAMVKFIAFPALIYVAMITVAPHAPDTPLYAFGSAGPAGTMAFALALLYGAPTERVAQVIVLTNVLTLFSLALLA